LNKHELAMRFHRLGLYTFPVRYVKDGNGKFSKKPVVKWRDAELPNNAIAYQEYGVRLDARYLVVDVDIKDGKKGNDTWWKMVSLLKDPSMVNKHAERLICGTMSGGTHHFFKLPPGTRIKKKVDGFPDIDFLSEGAYIVGPGTNFGTGMPYAIVSGAIDDDYIPDCPEEWLVYIVQRETELRVEAKDFTNTSAALRQFRDYCASAPAAVEYHNGNDTTYKVACTARDLGIDDEHCFKIMWEVYNPRCHPPWDAAGIETVIQNAYAYAKGAAGGQDYSELLLTEAAQEDLNDSVEEGGYKWDYNRNGMPRANNENNVICYLTAKNKGDFQNEVWGAFRYNAFTESVEYSIAPPWYNPQTAAKSGKIDVPKYITPDEIGKLKHYLFQKYGYNAERQTIRHAVDFVARQYKYHPIRSWLRSLVWDGIPRLDDWLIAYCGAPDTPYVRAVGPKVLIGAVARIMDPGCKMDYTLILEGDQGVGKSTVCQILGVRPEWFASMRPDIDKDARQVLSTKWIVEYAEIDALGQREASQVKAYMTTSVDTYRAPYDTQPRDYPRQSIFIGTVNPTASMGYLNDPTGSRRFWPVRVTDIDRIGLKRDIDRLYAEAFARYNAGELAFVTEGVKELFELESELRQDVDPYVGLIKAYWIANPDIGLVSIQNIAVNVCNIRLENYDKRANKRVKNALGYLGWRITGQYKDNARPPLDRNVAFLDKFLPKLPQHVQELRQSLKYPKALKYADLHRLWDMGVLSNSDKQRLSRTLREQEGVKVYWDTKDRVSKVLIKPLVEEYEF